MKALWTRIKNTVLNLVKPLLTWYSTHRSIRYWAVLLFFVLFTFVLGDANLYRNFEKRRRISELRKELRETKRQFHRDSTLLEALRSNKMGVEQAARELYLMKRPDELLFLLRDSNQTDSPES